MSTLQSQPVVPHTLAPEITDVIIDHLHDDIPTLATCGLICRDWLRSSRYHMFADLKLHLDDAQSLVDIFQHPSGNNIRAVVQRLVLKGLDKDTQYIGDNFDIKNSLKAAAAQQRALRFLGNCFSSVQPVVKHVRLCSSRAEVMDIEPALFLLSSMNRNVTSLELVDFAVVDFSYALDVIYTLPQLDMLLLDGFSFGRNERPDWTLAGIRPERIGQGPSSIIILDCPDDSTRMILSWALTRQPLPRLDIPVINCETTRSRGACETWRTIWLSPLISVEHLRIKFVDKLSIEDGVLIDLRPCTNIHTLELYDIVPHPEQGSHTIAAPMLLSCITSTRVERVVLAFKYTTFVEAWMAFFDWAGVVEKLARPEFSHLRTLEIRSGPWGQPRVDAVKAESLLRQGPLSMFHNKGILEIVFDPPFL